MIKMDKTIQFAYTNCVEIITNKLDGTSIIKEPSEKEQIIELPKLYTTYTPQEIVYEDLLEVIKIKIQKGSSIQWLK